MEYTDQFTEQDFIEFKEQLVLLAQEQFNACNTFVNQVQEADSPSRLKEVFIYMADEIFSKLGGETDTDDLERHIESLQDEVCELEDKIQEHDDLFPTVYDEMKYQTFLELHSKYTPWEFEQLLLNGKL
jgi:hypothetical protein